MSKFFYRLAGTNYDVIKHCSADIRAKYRNLVFALFLTTLLSFIGGADIAHQFSTNPFIILPIAILWASFVFSFDYFLINGGDVNSAYKFIRIPVGLSNIFITMVALFILLNQASIDSTLRLENTSRFPPATAPI